MRRPRTRSLTKVGSDHNDDTREVVQTEEETPLTQQPKPKAQTRQKGGQTFRQFSQQSESSKYEQSKQSQPKKSTTLGRPRKNQSNKELSSSSKAKYTKRKSTSLNGRPKQKSKAIIDGNDDDYEDEFVDMEYYDHEEYEDDYYDDEDEIMFEEFDDPNDRDYSPKDIYKTNRGKRSLLDFRRTPFKSKSPVRPAIRNLIQGSPSSGNTPNLDTSTVMPNVSLPHHQNRLQYPDYTQAGNTNERITPQKNKKYVPMREIPLPRIVPIPTSRNDVRSQHCETEFDHNLQSSNESQRIPHHNNNYSQTNHIPHITENISSRNIQNQFPSANHQPSPMNQAYTESTQTGNTYNTYNTAHISEPRETGRTSCDICNSTGCTTQKTSTTITIKMTTVTDADINGNMTTKTYVETDISPVTGTIESTEQTEVTVETSEHPSRLNVIPTTSFVGTDQNKPNETPLLSTPQETIQESEQHQNHINQHQINQEPTSISVPTSVPISDPIPNPVPNPDSVSNFITNSIANSVANSVADSVADSIADSISNSASNSASSFVPNFVPKPVSKPILQHFPKIIAPNQGLRLENANLAQHNQALQNLLNTTQQNQSSLSSDASQQLRINRPILPYQNQQSQPRSERLKHNIESIINSVDSSPNNVPVNSSNLLRKQTHLVIPANSTTDVVKGNSVTSLQDFGGISDSSPSTQKSQKSSSKKKATRKRSAPSPTKRKNQKILPNNKSSSEPQIVISPYMMKAFKRSNSSMQDVTYSSTEVGSSQQSSPYNNTFTSSTVQSIPYFNSMTPPRPPIFNTNDTISASVNTINPTNNIPIITTPHNEMSRGLASITPHSNSTIQPSNSSTPQVSSSNNTRFIRDSYNNPFVVSGIGGSSSESTPTVNYNNERLIRSGSSSKTISTNGGGVGYDSRGSSVVNSLEQLPPYYHIPPIETMGSVTDIWNEWNVGINGNPSVILMMERYGGKWVYENEYHLKKRRFIVKEVQVRSDQIGIYEALTELERLRSGNSLLWLADRIRTRE